MFQSSLRSRKNIPKTDEEKSVLKHKPFSRRDTNIPDDTPTAPSDVDLPTSEMII